MNYNEQDYQAYSQKFNESILMSFKVSFTYQNKDYNGSLFVNDDYIVFIKAKEEFIYRIPITDIIEYEKVNKIRSAVLTLIYGNGYYAEISFKDKNEPDLLITYFQITYEHRNKKEKFEVWQQAETEYINKEKRKLLDQDKSEFNEWKEQELISFKEMKAKYKQEIQQLEIEIEYYLKEKQKIRTNLKNMERERLANIESKYNEVKEKVDQQRTRYNDLVKEYDNKQNELEQDLLRFKERQINSISEQKEKVEKELSIRQDELEQAQSELSAKRKEKRAIQRELTQLRKDQDIMQVFVSAFEEDVTSHDLKNKLGMLTLEEKEMFKDGDAAIYYGYEDEKKIVNAQLKQILRSFNTECDYMLSNVTAKNYESYHSRIIRAYETLNKIYSVDSVEITKPYLEKKLEKLNLIYQYQIKVQQEKELQREIKEQIKEEERVKREIEQEKKKIEKEETQFSNEVRSLFKRLEKSQSDIEKELYADKIKELENKIKELEEDKKNVLEREANTRAGYVYIISNIGSFGEDIYKIGVTRRLEPYDRVKELGDASVPFEFDVHAMIFSDDAPNLENILHKHFRDREVNKVNHRKEFFKVNIDEIEQVVKENHNNTVEFIKVPVAEQYWQSQNIDELNTDY
ncbi:DUF4041 domain-containing protein [Staphylococcus simulans]|uniref:DUF4041 domain-containing protein n=2 Tax=Staphylococcus simulans TaxID=1286 RepID=UPI0021D2759E|nr:DUF4041 domain-containing protein [Staphylococcus simulans]UXR49597.1 DUF4041 domain-containing protein [Staphylococcus simulans]